MSMETEVIGLFFSTIILGIILFFLVSYAFKPVDKTVGEVVKETVAVETVKSNPEITFVEDPFVER